MLKCFPSTHSEACTMLSPTPSINRPSLHPGAGYVIGPRVPHGLAAVVEGLTREVLRHRPEDIYVFAAHHFEKLLKLREQHHAEKYRNIREFDDNVSREFNLWPTKESGNTGISATSGWSLDKESKDFERRGKMSTDVTESSEDVSTDMEKRKISKQTCTRSSGAKRASRKSTKDATSDPCATKIIPQMSALRGSGRTILTKDIKQELRKNKLNSGEKGKMSDGMEKGIRGERRSKTKISKTDKNAEEEVERAATTTASKISARKPLKKVRRIETESETETEREIATKDRLGNSYERVGVKGDSANREAVSDCIRSRSRRSEATAWPSEHSSERKVSSRALSMDRIRAYVLRKFASTASLEVLRSPTYVEQVQEVIDRAAPIIKEKLEEIRRPRGKRSRSVDFAWNEESFRRCVARDSRRCDERDEEERSKRKSSNGAPEQESAEAKDEDKSEDQSTTRDDVNPLENGEKPPRRRSAGSGRQSRRRESAGHHADDDSRQSNKPEPEPGRDTLEARLTATQSILEGISMSASELNGARKIDPIADERGEPSSEASDHVNMVSLPIVRPPSSKSCRNATKNGSDSLVLPPISPEAPRSTKKKDELSLPILPAAPNGSHSVKRSQEQDSSKDAEEASTMCDITSDMDDIAVLPEDEDGQMIAGAKRDSMSDHRNLMSDMRFADGEEGKEDKDAEEALWKDTPRELAGKLVSDVSLDRDLEEYRESTAADKRRAEEIYKDSLNVTPEVVEVPSRPDSLEPDEDEDVNGDNVVQNNRFDDLKDRLIEVEMAERNIEKALTGQQTATHNDEAMSIEEMNEARKSTGEDGAGEVEKSMSEQGTPKEEGKSMNGGEKKEEESANKVERGSNDTEGSTDGKLMSSEEGKSLDEEEEKEELTNGTGGSDNVERLKNGRGISSEERKLSEEEEKEEEKSAIEPESPTVITNEELIEKKESEAQVGVSTKEAEKVPNGVEEVMVKRHVQKLESANTRDKIRNDQIVHGTRGKEDTTESNGVTLRENTSSQATDSRDTADEHLEASLPTDGSDVDKTKSRKKRKTNELPATTPLSLKIPFSYVLSEGSPYEIPDFVTTVIIPDRSCPSPVIEIENLDQPGSTYPPIESTAHNIVEDVSSRDEETRQGEDCVKYGMEAFGEYIRPEVVPADFVQSVRSGQDIVIIHQDLDRIKEEGEEDEEADENDERKEAEDLEKKNDAGQTEETVKLEDIAEHEENEAIPDEVLSSCVPESEALAETTKSTDPTNADKTDVAEESRSMLDNSSEENGSSQDIHTTTTSSEAKESTASNRSIENSSVGRPLVPELNLDSLQDNTVSSFKMTANGTATKESNCSPKESDATMSLVEPLTPDEKLSMGNRLVLADRELETPVEELVLSSPNFLLQSDVPEADQLYPAEHAEYELLEKDPLSTEAVLEDEAEAQEEDAVSLKASVEAACVDSSSRKKRETEELDSEEEIARELIGLLDKEAQLHAAEERSPQDKPTESNLHVDDGSNRPLLDTVHSVDEAEGDENCVLPERSGKLDNKNVSRTEATNEVSDHIEDGRKNEAEDKIANEETEDSRLEAEEKKGAESNQVVPLAESEQDESSVKDNATNKETEEPEEEVEGEKHTEISQVAPLAEFERDELLENDSHETANGKIVVENERDVVDADLANAPESSEDKRIDVEDALKSHSSESTSKTEEPREKREESDHEEREDRGESKRKSVEIQEECQEEELNNEDKRERNGSVAREEDDKENMEVQEAAKSRVDSLKKSTEKGEDAEHDETATTKPITPEEFIADDQKDTTSEKEEKADDLSAKLENVHGPITNAISEQSTQDDHHVRWTMGTKSSTAETVIAAFDPSEDEKTKSLGDDFLPAVVKIQACVRGFLARRRLRKDLCTDSVSEDVASAQKTAVASNEHLPVPEEHSNLRETKCGRHRLRREEALRKTTLSLENAFATSRLQHTGEFHDSVPLPLFDMTRSETNSDDSLNESLDEGTEEEPPKTDNAKSSGTTDSDCHDDGCREGSQKSDTFADHSDLPIMMQLLADATRNCHFRINSDPNVGAGGAKLMEPALDFLMLGYPRDDTTLQNRYLNFITSVEDIGSNMDYLPSDVKTKGTTNDAQPSVTSGEASMPESLREPLALPGIPQGVVIEELTSLDEPTAGDVSPTKSESMKASSATKTSLDTNSSVPLEECALEKRKNSESSITRTNSADKDNAIANQKNTVEKAGDACNSPNVGEVGLHGENMSERSCAIFHGSNGHASGGEDGKM